MRKWKYILTDMMVGLLMGVASIIIADLLASCSNPMDETAEHNELPHSPDGLDGMALSLQIHTADYLPGYKQEGGNMTDNKRASKETVVTRSATHGIEGISSGALQLLCFDSKGSFIGMARDVTNSPSTADGKNQNMKAIVPSATTTIHFLANANISPDESWLGKSEAEIIDPLESRYDTHKQLIYWGYIHKNTLTEMKTFLENPENIVDLLRDSAKITVNIQDETVAKAELTVCNAFATGKMTAGRNDTPGNESGGSTSQEAFDLSKVNVPSEPAQRIDGTEADLADVAFTFEHPNRPGDYLRPILRITYKDGTIRYHHICLINDLHEPYPILRNHEYRINLIKLGKDTGYSNFAGARQGEPSNNAFVTVDDIVPEISDGEHSMMINDGTSIVLNTGASTEQVIDFTYLTGSSTSGSSGTGTSSGTNDMNASDFKLSWVENNGLATDASPSLSYDPTTGKGEIRYQLSTITDHLKTATLNLLDTKHGLSRTIHLYSISQFTLSASFKSSMGDNLLGKAKGSTGELTLEVPADYPEDLLPIDFKIASNDINPKDLGIEVSSTADVDGSKLDSNVKPWNCWFVYQASAPGTHTITIMNVRLATAGTQGEFYVKAAHFGEPTKISFTYQ